MCFFFKRKEAEFVLYIKNILRKNTGLTSGIFPDTPTNPRRDVQGRWTCGLVAKLSSQWLRPAGAAHLPFYIEDSPHLGLIAHWLFQERNSLFFDWGQLETSAGPPAALLAGHGG